MKLLLDTHFLLWIVLGSDRLAAFPWLDDYRPWGVSPISFLEIQFLAETDRLDVVNPEFTEAVKSDPRFLVDEPPLLRLVEAAFPVDWTRDPFDRMLCAHSDARATPLASLDRRVRRRHRLVAREIREGA